MTIASPNLPLQRLVVEARKRITDTSGYEPQPLRPILAQVLPSGRLYSQLHLDSSMDVSFSLRNLDSALRSFHKNNADPLHVSEIDALTRDYLSHCEQYVYQTLDLSSPLHQAFLLVLRELLPPSTGSRPTIFLIAGPSASGKDHVVNAVFDALRARGYICQFAVKYIQRKSRPEERLIPPFLRYQIAVSAEEFYSLQEVEEIVCPYMKYGSVYGFSSSNLRSMLSSTRTEYPIVNVAIMSAFEQASAFISHLTTLGFRVVPVLLYARLNVCRSRLLNRLIRMKNDESVQQDEALSDLWLRAEEVSKDIALINSKDELIEKVYLHRVCNDYDADSRSVQELYSFIVRDLMERVTT